jgi:transcription elongation factor GreA-like protein
MIDYNQVEINDPIDDLFVSVNDIYEQYDEGEIDHSETIQILKRICEHFIKASYETN